MLLMYAAPGAMMPLLSLRLDQELGFSPLAIGMIYATQAMALLVAPLAVGQVADRFFPAERCLAVCALLGGGLLWLLAGLTSYASVLAVTLAFWLVMCPTLSLGIALSF